MNIYKIIATLFSAAYLAFYAMSANALALSEVELKSHLNQQFDANIELIGGEAAELDDLRIQLNQIVEHGAHRYQFNYEVVKTESGRFLKITSSDVVREPIIEFALDIGWSGGHLVREYSVLIDPAQN